MQIFYWLFGWLLKICYAVVPILPVALILLTIISKVLLLPLTLKQQKSQVKMAKLKPEMDKIKAKYGTNQQKYSEELQKLYQKENYSPTAGCLPLLIQFPIIIGLYGVIYQPLTYILSVSAEKITEIANAIKANAEGFAGLKPDAQTMIDSFLSDPAKAGRGSEIVIANNLDLAGSVADGIDRIDFSLFGIIDLSQTPNFGELSWLWLIPLFAVLSQIVSSYVSMKVNGSEINGMSKGMIFGMPLLSGIFAFSMPAMVGFYWVISNVIMMLQSILLKLFYNPEKSFERQKQKQEKKKAKEREEKLERLRRIHGDDDEDLILHDIVKNEDRPDDEKVSKGEIKRLEKERLAKSRKLEGHLDEKKDSTKQNGQKKRK